MGLDTSHDCWHGSYSWFAEWRQAVANAANASYLPPADLPNRVFYGWWDDEPEDIINVLMWHSDCEGYIFPQHAEKLARRLLDVAPAMPEGWMRDKTYAFAAGLLKAADAWQIVEFH